MSSYPETLADHLEGGVTTICHCWRLTRRDGQVSGFTDHDQPLTIDTTVCSPECGFGASEARDTLGLAADTVDVEGALSSAAITEADIAAGLYDGATIETFLINWRSPADFVRLRTATIGKITRVDQRFVAELESLVHTLDRPSGRFISRACDADLGDARCRALLDHADFSASGAVVEPMFGKAFMATGLETYGAGWFTHGTLTWTSGPAAGRIERIEEHRLDPTGAMLVLRPGGGYSPIAGETFSVSAGCNKTFATCKAKFDNIVNFRGFPHLPGNDAAYAYVIDGGEFDGGPLVR